MDIHIALAPEILTSVFGVPITNTLITAWGVIALLAGGAALVRRRLKMIPGKIQAVFELIIEYILNYMEETLESRERARKYFPLIATIFLFIFTANVLEFTPGIGSVGFFHGDEFTPLLRSVNTDLNVTLALAIISFLVIEISGIVVVGFLKYAGKFINFKSVMGFLIGIIELFSELARLISFSFRLFGNIFAGEVLILVITAFVPILLPIPFMAFELFVGFIQAAIFALLTLFFLKIALVEPEH